MILLIMFPADVVYEICKHTNLGDALSLCLTSKMYTSLIPNIRTVRLAQGQLLPHQINCVAWCFQNEAAGKNMIINIDTGSGKTGIVAYMAKQTKLPSLLVARSELYDNWKQDCDKLYGKDAIKIVNLYDLRKFYIDYCLARKSARILGITIGKLRLENILLRYNLVFIDIATFDDRYSWLVAKNCQNLFSRIIIDECHRLSHGTDYYDSLLQNPLIKIGLTANNIKPTASQKYNIFRNPDGRFSIYNNDSQFKQQVKSQTIPQFINIIVENSVSKMLHQNYTKYLTLNQEKIVDSKGELSTAAAKRLTIQCSGKMLEQIRGSLNLDQLLSSRCVVYANDIYWVNADIGVSSKSQHRLINEFNNNLHNSIALPFSLSDGINFKNVNNLIILGIPSNYPKFKQIVGRVHRMDMEKANVYYASTFDGLDHHIIKKYIDRYNTEYTE